MSLSLLNLFLEYDGQIVFEPISITLMPGSVGIISGKNGSGKTSLLRMIAGMIPIPQSAEIIYNGYNILTLQKPYLNFIEHQTGVLDNLTVMENLEFWSRSYGSILAMQSALAYFGLEDLVEVKCGDLSAGNKKKVAIARLACCNSNLWLLDEVEVNLDEENKNLLYNLINIKVNNGGIVIMSSHNDLPFQDAVRIQLCNAVNSGKQTDHSLL